METGLDISGDELSCEACTACNHPRAFHRSRGGSCFGELNKNRASRSDSLSVEGRKSMGLECWCLRFEITIESAVRAVLLHGDKVALITSTSAALERGDQGNAEQLLDRYIRKFPQSERDTDWITATRRALTRLQSKSLFNGRCGP